MCFLTSGYCWWSALRMCNAAFQCPGTSRCGPQHFDDVIGQCVCETDCTVGAPELPPGLAIGRPFLSAKTAPTFSDALEQASDWSVVV